MQVINKKIIVIFICLFIFSFGLFKLFNKKEIVLDEVKLDIRDTNNNFAIYLENEYKSNSYKESDTNEFPKIGYSFNKDKSQCVSIDGDVIDNILSYDNETNKVIVDTTDSINCYIYFDRLTLGDSIKVLEPNGLNLDVTSNSDEWTGMYRFQGQQEDGIDNYICFGTSDSGECKAHPNKYMYRIIGIEENGRIKVIKKEALDKTDQWWSDYDISKHWSESLVFQHINGETFLNNEELVPKGWENKIDNNKWLFGTMNNRVEITGAGQTGVEVYKIESGQKEAEWDEKAVEGETYKGQQAIPYTTTAGIRPGNEYYYITHKEKWSETELPHEINAKIGLINLSDYYLSVSNETNCHIHSKIYEKCPTGWIHLSQNNTNSKENIEITMTRVGWGINYGDLTCFAIFNTGDARAYGLSRKASVRPVFFLKNDIKIIDGNGKSDEPFIIN